MFRKTLTHNMNIPFKRVIEKGPRVEGYFFKIINDRFCIIIIREFYCRAVCFSWRDVNGRKSLVQFEIGDRGTSNHVRGPKFKYLDTSRYRGRIKVVVCYFLNDKYVTRREIDLQWQIRAIGRRSSPRSRKVPCHSTENRYRGSWKYFNTRT